MQGATYFGTKEAIDLVMAHIKEVIGFNMDDIVFTGTIPEVANVSRIDYGFYHFRGGNHVNLNFETRSMFQNHFRNMLQNISETRFISMFQKYISEVLQKYI